MVTWSHVHFLHRASQDVKGVFEFTKTHTCTSSYPRMHAAFAMHAGPWGFQVSIALSPYSFTLLVVVVVLLSFGAWLVKEGLFWSAYSLLFGTPYQRHFSPGGNYLS